jgi:hypothetical protein
MRGLVICVEYDDLLVLTLPIAMRRLSECLVITSLADEKTANLASRFPNVKVLRTNAFYEDGASFNKGKAMEQGFDTLGRDGWMLIWDADTALVDPIPAGDTLDSQRLYGARRHLLEDASLFSETMPWKRLPVRQDAVIPGYFQLFNGAADALKCRPWYETAYVHAGGGDTYFERLWPPHLREWLPATKVVHLGPVDRNWFGRQTERIDGHDRADGHEERRVKMDDFLSRKGWGRPRVGDGTIERIGQTKPAHIEY